MIEQTVGELLKDHVTLDLEGIDRLYLNLYQPRLQTGGGVATFFKGHRGAKVASTVLMAPISRDFVKAIHAFAKREGVDIVRFAKGQRKDEVTRERLKDFSRPEGVLYIGTAQERFASFRMIKKRSVHTGQSYPWFTRGTVMCNHYYFYLVDEDFGPLFIKFCSYFPYTARVCLNGHEYVKRQLAKEGIAFEALDNGLLTCADPARAQQILDDLTEEKIAALVAKWLGRLPDPFTAADHAAGYNFQLSILQAEFSRTQVFDRPLAGRHLFEAVIRENLDLGRPEKVSLIFNRRITKRTPGTFHTRLTHPRGHPLAARQLQILQDQAVLQGRPRPAHRDHDQQHPRLWHRTEPQQPARPAGHRLCRQPPTAGGRDAQPGLSLGRGGVRSGHPTAGDGRPTRLRLALR